MVFFTQSWIFLENRLQNDIEKTRCSCVSNSFIVHDHTVTQHHCFHNYFARKSEIFPPAGQMNFLKLLEKVNISFIYLNKYWNNFIYFIFVYFCGLSTSSCLVDCKSAIFNLERLSVTLTSHLNSIMSYWLLTKSLINFQTKLIISFLNHKFQ